MTAIRLPADTERRLEALSQKTGRSLNDLFREAIREAAKILEKEFENKDPGSGRIANDNRVIAHDRLMERLEKGWDLGGGRFDRDSLYDR